MVCHSCGLVFSSGIFPDHCPFYKRKSPPYVHLFHWNERCTQFCMDEPAIPDIVYELIEEEFSKIVYNNFGYYKSYTRKYPSPFDLTQKQIRNLLGSIVVPEGLAETIDELEAEKQEELNEGKKRRKLPKIRRAVKPITNLKTKYAEKWLSIKMRLCDGVSPFLIDGLPNPSADLINKLKTDFSHLPPVFLRLFGGERHNMPSYNLTFVALLQRHDYDPYTKYFHLRNKGPQFAECVRILRRMFEYLGWELPLILQNPPINN